GARRERRVHRVSRREAQLLGPGLRDGGRGGMAGQAETAMTRVVIVDDHPVVREGLVAALNVDVVGVFASAEEALAARTKAEVIVLDLELPGMSGLDAIARFDAPVLVLTAYAADEDIDRALAAGAKGYLLKGAPLDDIERAIAAVARGESVLDPRITSRVLARRQRLPPREPDVLRLIAAGKSNKEIAA